jgi:hypothetical protein
MEPDKTDASLGAVVLAGTVCIMIVLLVHAAVICGKIDDATERLQKAVYEASNCVK